MAAGSTERQSPAAAMLAEIGKDDFRRWSPVPDKYDVVSRPYFTLTAPCVLHLSALALDESLGEKCAV